MNRAETKKYVEENNIVVIKADRTKQPTPEIDKLLVELGNTAKAIPFYAVYPADGGEPVVFDGLLSMGKVIDALKQAGASKSTTGRVTKADETAMTD